MSSPASTRSALGPRSSVELLRASLRRIARTAIQAAVAWEVARLLGAELPVFATIVPLLATKDDPFSAFNVSAARLLGVTAGVVLGLAALEVDGASALGVGVVLLVGLALGAFVRLGPELNSQVAVSALLVVATGAATGTPAGYALDRLWETAIGAVVTLALAPLLWPPDPLAEVRARLARLRSWLVDDLRTTATLFGGGEGPLEEHLDAVISRAGEAVVAAEGLAGAERGLRFNIRRRNDREEFADTAERVRLAAEMHAQSRRLARDALSFEGRDDLVAEVERCAVTLRHVIDPVIEAVGATLDGHPDAEAAARAEREMAAWKDADSHAVAVIIRRAPRYLLDEAERPASSPAAARPIERV